MGVTVKAHMGVAAVKAPRSLNSQVLSRRGSRAQGHNMREHHQQAAVGTRQAAAPVLLVPVPSSRQQGPLSNSSSSTLAQGDRQGQLQEPVVEAGVALEVSTHSGKVLVHGGLHASVRKPMSSCY
jgi:hypothetical protein